MTALRITALVVFCMFVAACALPPEEAEQMRRAVEEAVRAGQITEQRAAVLREAIDQAARPHWEAWVSSLLAIVAGYFGLSARAQLAKRGPAKPMDPQMVADLHRVVDERRHGSA